MQKTNLVPAVEERTVSGSSVSFNSAFALPLKACKVSFSATQAGSGEPSPSNPRAISGVSAIGLTANSTPVSVSLGDTRYGGYVDVVEKSLKINRIMKNINKNSNITVNNSYIKSDACCAYITYDDIYPLTNPSSQPDLICNRLKQSKSYGMWGNTGYANMWCINNNNAFINIANDLLGITDYTQETTTTARNKIKSWLENNSIDLIIPIAERDIAISDIPDLSSIIGNNTFSTDIGTLEITFADLQEKSASGSVASFNTALAMPLVNGEFSIQAYQEGKGDPSPVNVRNIVPRREVNITRAGKNLLNFNSLIFANPSSMSVSNTTPRKWVDNSYCIGISHNNYANTSGVYEYEMLTNGFNVRGSAAYGINIPLQLPPLSQITVSAESIVNGKIEVAFYGADGTWLSSSSGNYQTKTFTVPANTKWSVLVFTSVTSTSIGQFRNILVEAGSQATDYEAYNGEVKTVQLGQDVYGGVYNSASGELTVNRENILIDNTATLNVASTYIKSDACDAYVSLPSSYPSITFDDMPNDMCCNKLKVERNRAIWTNIGYPNCWQMNGRQIHINIANSELGITDYTQETVETVKVKMSDWLANNHLEFIIVAPDDEISLTPTPINTFNGNNSIFCDTGDIDLTYNDLDIAKRGNFREVFKLPS